MSHIGPFAIVVLALVAVSGCGESSARNVLPQPEQAQELRAAIDNSSQAEGDGGTEKAAPVRTGWATIKGRFVVEGVAPTLAPLRVDKDQSVCAPGGKPVPNESIEVGTDGGLVNVAVYAQGLGSEGENVHESASTPASETVLFDQKECEFLTRVCPMQVGQELLIKNSDPVSHNTSIDTRRSPAFNQTLSPNGDTRLFKPVKPEKAPASVVCSVHPWMQAYLLPHENGYVSVSGGDGSFEIKNLPAGIDLKIQVWHEALKKFDNIEVNGTKTTWKRGVVKLDSPLEPDEERELIIKIPAGLFGG